MAAEDKSIMVGQVDDKVFVKIIGRGMGPNSQILKDFVFQMMDKNITNFTVDFEKCTIIDSTFIGTLLAINNDLEGRGYKNALELINLSSANVRTLEMIGLTKFIPILKKGDKTIFNLKYLENREFSRLETVQHIYDAHELLGRINEENKIRFRYVNQFVREELENLKGKNQAAGEEG